MTRCSKHILLLMLLVAGVPFSPVHVQAQQSVVRPVEECLNILRSGQHDYYRENVYCHLSQSDLLTGETLRFTGFCLGSNAHKPSTLSKTLYVEILDRTGRAVVQKMVPLSQGMASGSTFLPSTMESDYYIFRAYTRWMKNFGDGSFFTQIIRVVNPFRPLGMKPVVEDKQVGHPISGSIAHNPGTQSISIAHGDGPGTLQVTLSKGGRKDKKYIFVLVNNGKLVDHHAVHCKPEGETGLYDGGGIMPGNVYAVLMEEDGDIASLSYHQYTESPPVNPILYIEHKTYTRRSPVTVQLSGRIDWEGANMSVCVSPEGKNWHRPGKRIDAYLATESGLFPGNNISIQQEADGMKPPDSNLTLQREVDLQNTFLHLLLGPDTLLHLPDYREHLIRGTVKSGLTGNPMFYQVVYLSVPGLMPATYVGRSDRQGHIEFVTKDFFGSNQIVVLPEDTVADLQIEIENPFAQGHAYALPDLELDEDLRKILEMHSISMQVENVYRSAAPIVEESPVDNKPFYYKADEVYHLDDYTRFPVMEEVFREYIHGVLVRKRNGRFVFKVIDPLNNSVFQKPPIILLDGVPVFDAHKIMQIDPLVIEKIEVVTREYYYSYKTFYGIISLHTYEGNLSGYVMHPRARIESYDAYAVGSGYTMPDYGDGQRHPEADFRSLLYWNSNLGEALNASGSFTFFTSDLEGAYRIEIQGITSEGTPFSATAYFEVAGSM